VSVSAALTAAALVGVLVPLELDLPGLPLRTGAIRPAIGSSALTAVAASPLVGVGAAPFRAAAPDPMGGPGLYVWDAHHAYLSVLGQFGLVGAALLAAGAALCVRALLRAAPSEPEPGS
jgi:O-antigen ligase